MRLVIAVLRPSLVESVRQSLAAVQVTRMTIGDAQGHVAAAGSPPVQQTVIQIACNDDFVERATTVIAGVLAAAGDDAGRLFTLPLVDAVQLYRGVRGPEAI